MIESINPAFLKESIDKAIITIGHATSADDIDSAYNAIVSNYAQIKRAEKMGEVQFTMNEEDFLHNLQHIANYNLVRVANSYYEAAMKHSMEADTCRREITICMNTIKNDEGFPLEKSLIQELNTLLKDASVSNTNTYN